MPQVWDSSIDGFRSFLRRHRTLHGIAKRLRIGYRVREQMGVEPKFPSRKNIRCETIFDVIKPSVALSVPVYNENLHSAYPVGDVFKARQDEEFRREYEANLRRTFSQKVETLFHALKDDWRVLMIHFHITDLLGHIYWGTEKLAVLYEEMDLLTGRVKERLDPGDLVIIISDHGMGRYGHTKHGFYSLSVELGLENPDITDFFDIIKAVASK